MRGRAASFVYPDFKTRRGNSRGERRPRLFPFETKLKAETRPRSKLNVILLNLVLKAHHRLKIIIIIHLIIGFLTCTLKFVVNEPLIKHDSSNKVDLLEWRRMFKRVDVDLVCHAFYAKHKKTPIS